MSNNDIHVVPGMNVWTVRQGGSVLGNFPTQRDAEVWAIAKAKQDRVEVLVHGRDGTIRNKNSYGNDPSWIKG